MKHFYTFLLLFTTSSIALAQLFVQGGVIDQGARITILGYADLDGDGDVDRLVNHVFDGYAMFGWFPNDGTGGLGPFVGIERDTKLTAHFWDVDNDGDLDILTEELNSNDAFQWHVQVAPGIYVPQAPFVLSQSMPSTEMSYNDFNGDGLLDLLAVNITWSGAGEIRFCPGATGGTFGAVVSLSGTLQNVENSKVIDLDGDGDLDILYGETNGTLYCIYNQGSSFGTVTALVTNSTLPMVDLADLDGDGDPDLITQDANSDYEWYENDGNASFSGPNALFTPFLNGYPVAFQDLDGDNDLDAYLFRTSGGSISASYISISLNDGSGSFSSPNIVLSHSHIHPSTIRFLDLDGDGTEELHYSRQAGGGLWRSVQTAPLVFQDPAEEVGWRMAAEDCAYGDLDGDGHSDVAVVGCKSNSPTFCKLTWYSGDGNGNFSSRNQIIGNACPPIRLADLENDGDLDIVTGCDTILMNDGTGNFSNGAYLPALATPDVKFELADIDGDAYPDLVVNRFVNVQQSIPFFYLEWYSNDGVGSFSPPVLIDSTLSWYYSNILHVNDLDGLGTPDIVYNDKRARNNGTGNFSLFGTGFSALDVKPIDLTGNGVLDLLKVEADIGWQAYSNTNYNSIFQGPAMWVPDGFYGPEGADFDQDGDNDIVVNHTSGTFGGSWYFENLGAVNFDAPVRMPFGGDPSLPVDMDADGDVDLLLCGGYLLHWLENTTTSKFQAEGRSFQDLDQDGVLDPGEPNFPLASAYSTPSPNYVVVDTVGNYKMSLDSGTYSIAPANIDPWWAVSTSAPSYNVTLSSATPMVTGLDFGYVPAIDTVVGSVSYTSTPARCDQQVLQWIDVQNTGTVTGQVNVQLILDTTMTWISSTPPPTSVSGNSYFWTLPQVAPFVNEQIELQVMMPDFTSLGNTLQSSAYAVFLDAIGDTASMVVDPWSEVLVCAYDPNDKSVAPAGVGLGSYIDMDVEKLRYTVRFQNTGNAPAEDVVIRDVIDSDLDLASLHVLGHSHPMTTEIGADREVSFRFENIQLPDSTNDEPNSHGFVRFEINLVSGLPPGTVISNGAGIYFDTNPPILTNTVYNTLHDCSTFSPTITDLGGGMLDAGNGVSFQWYFNGDPIPGATSSTHPASADGNYQCMVTSEVGCIAFSGIWVGIESYSTPLVRAIPNPFTTHTRLLFSEVLSPDHNVEVVDVNGRVLRTMKGNGTNEVLLEREGLSDGLYVVRISENGTHLGSARVVVE